MNLIKWIIFLGAIAVYVAGFLNHRSDWMALAKPLPMIVLITVLARRSSGNYRNWILLGFTLSLVGDLFLLNKQGNFLYGLAYFLFAHLCYIRAFLKKSHKPGLLLLLPFAIWGLLTFYGLRTHLGDKIVPVMVYITAICIMMWRAAVYARGGDRAARFACAGSIIFGVSDTILAFNHFADPLPFAPIVVILTYWSGQYLLSRSVR